MFKCYRQLEHSDCGLTCIRMIARHYGKKIPIRYLQGISDLSRLGMSIKDIVNCASKTGMNSVAVQIQPQHLKTMPLPAIIYWQQCHFVVLYKYKKSNGRFYIADPAQGKIAYKEDELVSYWIPEGNDKGLAILMEPNDDFASHEYPREFIVRDFFKYIFSFFKMHRMKFLIALLIAMVIMSTDFAIPMLLRKTVDEGIGLKDINLVVSLLLGQLAISIGGLVSSSGMDLILTKTGLGIHLQMVNTYLERLSKLPLSYFDKKISSDFIQKINDQSRIKDFLITFPNTTFVMLLTMTVFSILLFHYSPLIFTFFMGMSCLEIAWNASFLNRRKTIDYAYFINSSANTNHAYELTNGMSDLKVNNAENARIRKWKETQDAMNSISMKLSWLGIAQGGGHSVISNIKDLMVTGIGSAMVISGNLTIGTLMTLGYITGRLSKPFATIGSSISSLQDAMLSFQRIGDVVNECGETRGTEQFTEASVSLENVSFKYAGAASPYVITDMNLEIERGKMTALVGESGSGKSTLIKLMLGFYIPRKGVLRLSGHDVRDVDNQDWLKHCGVVMQEARLFSGSLLDNISLSDPKPDEKKAMELLESVGLSDFVNTLPMGIHTKIGSTGIEISGGQKQRVMIARALYKNPDLLFLDEATSSLDANNEKSIVSRINTLCKGKTIVIAAHRLSTVQNADKIVFIKDGRVSEMGTHYELLSNKGDYWKLVRNQLQLKTNSDI